MDKEQVIEILKEVLSFQMYIYGNPNVETNLCLRVFIDDEELQELDVQIR